MGMQVLTADLPEPTIYRLVFGSPIVGQTVSVKEHLCECLRHMLFDDPLTEYKYELTDRGEEVPSDLDSKEGELPAGLGSKEPGKP
jgi:hypothetical protein